MSELMEISGTSEATTRRDLIYLERHGVLVRTRGGARIVPRRMTVEDEFEIRRGRERREKRAIGQLVASRLSDGSALFLNDGSSAYALAQCIARRPLTVITTALNIAQMLAGGGLTEVIVVGGMLRGTSFGTVGPLAANAIAELHADVAIIGADGVDLRGGVSQHNIDDAAVAKTMSRNARRTIVLAAPSKVDRVARAHTLDWSQVDELAAVALPPKFATELGQFGVRVITQS